MRSVSLAARPGAIRRLDHARTDLVDDREHGEPATFVVTIAGGVQTCTCREKSRSSAPCAHTDAVGAFRQKRTRRSEG